MTAPPRRARALGLALGLAVACAGPAGAQIGLPSLGQVTGGLPRLPGGELVGDLTQRATDTAGAVVRQGLTAPQRLQGLIRSSRGALVADPQGWPVTAGELVVLDLSDDARAQAVSAGFTVIREESLPALGLTTTILSPPRGVSLAQATTRLKRLAPDAEVTFNHVLSPAGMAGGNTTPTLATAGSAPQARVGLIDTGVDVAHPALATEAIEQRGFAGPARVGGHGTAVASLLVGSQGAFHGAAPGAALRVADIYGGGPAGGSSTALAAALAWMVETRTRVVNISLVGPRNALVERAVARAQARGAVLVAAVGNDGPAAPPLFPASYPGVIGVTAVNARNVALPEAARGAQVDLAAPGAEMAAAALGGGYVNVRGASFAAPLVAGLIVQAMQPADADASAAVRTVTAGARDLGPRGRDPVYGDGLVGDRLRVAPEAVSARGRLAP